VSNAVLGKDFDFGTLDSFSMCLPLLRVIWKMKWEIENDIVILQLWKSYVIIFNPGELCNVRYNWGAIQITMV